MGKGSPLKTRSKLEPRSTKEIWTYQEYLLLPDDGKRYEILEGELEMTPSPSTFHQKVSRNLEMIIWNYVKKHNLGEIY
jgi:Uma2 family endonuclease